MSQAATALDPSRRLGATFEGILEPDELRLDVEERRLASQRCLQRRDDWPTR